MEIECYLVREAGLPFEALQLVSFPSTAALARELDARTAELRALELTIGDGLYQVIGGKLSREERLGLIELRRDVHNSRESRATQLLDSALVALIPDPLRSDLQRWQALRASCPRTSEAGKAAIRSDELRCARGLRELWGRSEVRTGILFSQPSLYERLDRAFSGARVSARVQQQSARTLIAYVQRMATKTSPFSTLTKAGFPTTAPASTATIDVFGPSAAVMRDLIRAFQGRLRRQLPLSLNTTLHVGPELVSFVVRDASERTGEKVVSIERTPQLDLIWQLVLRDQGAVNIAGLEKRVRSLFPGSAAGVAVAALIDQLCRIGLLTTEVGTGECDQEVLGRLAGVCDEHAPNESALRDALANAHARLKGLAAATQLESLREFELALAQAQAQLELPAGRNLVHHERLVVNRPPPPCLSDRLRDSFARLRTLLPLFSSQYDGQRWLSERFRAQFGSGVCENALEFLSTCASELPGAAGRIPTAGSVEEARRDFVQEVASLVPDESGVVSLPADLVARWGAAAERFRPAHVQPSAALLGHFLHEGTGAEFVLNWMAPGYGALVARYAVDDASLARLRGSVRRFAGELEPVELVGTFGFWGQRRPNLTARYLLYAGETTERSLADRIPWSDLAIVLDEASAAPRLRCKKSNRDLLPLHFGTLSPFYYPPIYRLLSYLGAAFVPDFSLLYFMEERLAPEALGKLRHYPRITLDAMVLRRETWCLPGTTIPARDETRDEMAAFLELRSWAAKQGMPRQVFVTPLRVVDYAADGAPAARLSRVRKPFYVDWDELPSHRLFHRYVDAVDSTVTICEALPAPASDSPAFNLEYLFEMATENMT